MDPFLRVMETPAREAPRTSRVACLVPELSSPTSAVHKEGAPPTTSSCSGAKAAAPAVVLRFRGRAAGQFRTTSCYGEAHLGHPALESRIRVPNIFFL